MALRHSSESTLRQVLHVMQDDSTALRGQPNVVLVLSDSMIRIERPVFGKVLLQCGYESVRHYSCHPKLDSPLHSPRQCLMHHHSPPMIALTPRLDNDREPAMRFLAPNKEFLETYMAILNAGCARAERAACAAEVSIEGWLEKEGGGTSLFGSTDWKLRYFRIAGEVFSYAEATRSLTLMTHSRRPKP